MVSFIINLLPVSNFIVSLNDVQMPRKLKSTLSPCKFIISLQIIMKNTRLLSIIILCLSFISCKNKDERSMVEFIKEFKENALDFYHDGLICNSYNMSDLQSFTQLELTEDSALYYLSAFQKLKYANEYIEGYIKGDKELIYTAIDQDMDWAITAMFKNDGQLKLTAIYFAPQFRILFEMPAKEQTPSYISLLYMFETDTVFRKAHFGAPVTGFENKTTDSEKQYRRKLWNTDSLNSLITRYFDLDYRKLFREHIFTALANHDILNLVMCDDSLEWGATFSFLKKENDWILWKFTTIAEEKASDYPNPYDFASWHEDTLDDNCIINIDAPSYSINLETLNSD